FRSARKPSQQNVECANGELRVAAEAGGIGDCPRALRRAGRPDVARDHSSAGAPAARRSGPRDSALASRRRACPAAPARRAPTRSRQELPELRAALRVQLSKLPYV